MSAMRLLFKQNLMNESANERKRSSRRIALIGLRFVSSATVFSLLPGWLTR